MKYFIKKCLILLFTLIFAVLFISCEDDAILEPQLSDDCQGSYCNLSLPNTKKYVLHSEKNPFIF